MFKEFIDVVLDEILLTIEELTAVVKAFSPAPPAPKVIAALPVKASKKLIVNVLVVSATILAGIITLSSSSHTVTAGYLVPNE